MEEAVSHTSLEPVFTIPKSGLTLS